MVDHHVMEWLVLQLSEVESLPADMLEFCAGLLLNLSLTHSGQRHCAQVQPSRTLLCIHQKPESQASMCMLAATSSTHDLNV